MSVYVDDAVVWWRGQRWAHMMADSLDELHAMAAKLGLPRRAFQNKTSGAHYDLTTTLRSEAIALGAIPISRHRDREQVRAVIRRAREQGRQGQPPADRAASRIGEHYDEAAAAAGGKAV